MKHRKLIFVCSIVVVVALLCGTLSACKDKNPDVDPGPDVTATNNADPIEPDGDDVDQISDVSGKDLELQDELSYEEFETATGKDLVYKPSGENNQK